MHSVAAVAAILAALTIGAMSPGPSFVLVARTSIGLSRRDGLAAAVGMGIGGVCFSGVALVGLYTLLEAVTWLYMGLKIAGGLYLVYIASKIWRGAATVGKDNELVYQTLLGLSDEEIRTLTSEGII